MLVMQWAQLSKPRSNIVLYRSADIQRCYFHFFNIRLLRWPFPKHESQQNTEAFPSASWKSWKITKIILVRFPFSLLKSFQFFTLIFVIWVACIDILVSGWGGFFSSLQDWTGHFSSCKCTTYEYWFTSAIRDLNDDFGNRSGWLT